jgi:hypothetical protein
VVSINPRSNFEERGRVTGPPFAAQLLPPVAVDDSYNATEDIPLTVNAPGVLGNDIDLESDPLTATLVSGPTQGQLSLSTDGGFTYTPNANANGSDSFTYTANDGTADSNVATVTITIAATSDPPAANDDVATTPEDTQVTTTDAELLANDSDPDGDPLTVTGCGGAVNGSVSRGSGSCTFTPNPNFSGTGSYTYTISDGQGGTDTATVTVTVTAGNDQPTANNDTATTSEDTPVTTTDAVLLANDSDPDGNPLTVTGCGGAVNGSVSRGSGSCTFTPNPNFSGTGSYTYTISDGQGGTDIATVTVTVTAGNDQPTANNDAATTSEGTPVTINVRANDTDPDGDALTVTAVTQPANGSAAISGGGASVTYTPNSNFNGTNTFNYTVSDGNGGSASAAVTVTVTPVNDPPVANNDAATTPEGTPVTINVRANDTDPDGDALTVTAVTQPANGSATISGGGASVTYTPNSNFNGSNTFNYTVSDGNGGTDTATVTVTVTAVNDPPVANPDADTTSEDTPVTTNVRANDTDPESATSALVVTACSAATSGTVSQVGNDSCRFTPTADFNGTATYTYTISDPQGLTDTALVTVAVNNVNDPPVANNDPATTPEDTPVTINVRTNDTDSDVGQTLTITAVSQPANGTVIINGGGSNVTYSPSVNFNGTNTFNYTISDGNGGTDNATVTVTVTPVNDAPNATDDGATTPENTAVTIPVRANDTDVDVGDVLTVTSVSQPANGSAAIGGGGANVTYTPNPNFNGTNSFTYTLSDGRGGSDVATVTVRVSSVNTAPPNATIDTPSGNLTAIQVGQTVSFTGSGVDSDGTIVSYSWDFGGGAANSTVKDPGAVQFNSVGLFTVVFNVTDNEGAVDPTPPSRQVQVSQAPPRQNLPPNTTIDTPAANVTIQAGQSISFAGTATDPDGTIAGYAWSFPGGTPSNSTQEDPANIVFNTPGVHVVVFNAADNNGATDLSPATRTISVLSPTGGNAPPNATITEPSGNVSIAVGASLTFEGAAADADGSIVSYLWNFGGGAPNSSVEDPGSVTFATEGTFLVTFNVTDDQGASDPTPPSVTIVVGSGGGGVNVGLNVDIESPGSAQRVDGHDVLFVMRAIATQDLRADVSGDGVVNQVDVQLVLAAIGEVD